MSYKSLVGNCTANKQQNGGKPVSCMYGWENGSWVLGFAIDYA